MSYTVMLEDKLTAEPIPAGGLTFTPIVYGHAALGGPKRAEITAKGNDVALWQGLNNIGQGIRLYSGYGDDVWWGYIHEAQLDFGVFVVRVSMDQVANKVRVIYTTVETGTDVTGENVTTSFLYDLESINKYGLKELTYSASDMTTTTADNLRSTLLDQMKVPIPEITLIGGDNRDAKLTYFCRGWWDTLDWRYYATKYEQYGYPDNGTGALEFGYLGVADMVAQSFQLPAAGLIVQSATVGLYRTGNPADDLTAAIYPDAAGIPGTAALATSDSFAGSLLKNGVFTQTKFTFSSPLTAAGTTTYWLVIDRSGASSTSDYYVADLDFTAGYTGGAFKIRYGPDWVDARIPVCDMGFILSGENVGTGVETTTQIKNMVEYHALNVPITTAEIIDASGITHTPYRDDENTILYEVTEMLKLGTSNNRRLLAKVLANKTVQIYEEPANTSTGYVNAKGDVFDIYGGKMRKETCPVGLWVDLRSIAPAGASFGIIGAQTPMFIEESEYDVGSDRLRVQSRDYVGAFDFLRVRNG